MKRESLEEFDAITDLSEAKSCLKITYRRYENCHAGARFFMFTTVLLAVALLDLGLRQ